MYISIAGNIGSGKSTIVDYLSTQNIQSNIVHEPVESMNSILDRFYKNMDQWAFTLQLFVIKLYSDIVEKNKESANNLITERSQYESHEIFAKQLKHMFTEEQSLIFEDYYKLNSKMPDCFIYIHTSPETCIRRIQMRGRKSEMNISYSYIYELHNLYVNAFMNKPNVFVINGEDSVENVQRNVLEIINNILC